MNFRGSCQAPSYDRGFSVGAGNRKKEDWKGFQHIRGGGERRRQSAGALFASPPSMHIPFTSDGWTSRLCK